MEKGKGLEGKTALTKQGKLCWCVIPKQVQHAAGRGGDRQKSAAATAKCQHSAHAQGLSLMFMKAELQASCTPACAGTQPTVKTPELYSSPWPPWLLSHISSNKEKQIESCKRNFVGLERWLSV